MTDITEDDRVLIDELRKSINAVDKTLLTPKYDTDYNLLRWLKAYNREIKEVEEKLKRHLILRRALDLDNIETNRTNF